MEEKMEVCIEVFVNTYNEIKELVRLAADIQKRVQLPLHSFL